MWIGLVGISAVCAGLGFIAIQNLPTADGRMAQAFAAGAMLTMLADAMMPEAFEHGGITVGLFYSVGIPGSSHVVGLATNPLPAAVLEYSLFLVIRISRTKD